MSHSPIVCTFPILVSLLWCSLSVIIVHSRRVGFLDLNRPRYSKGNREPQWQQKTKSWKRQDEEEVLSLQQECWSPFWIPLAKKHGGKFTWWAVMIPLSLLSNFPSSISFPQLPLCEGISRESGEDMKIIGHLQHVGKGYGLSDFQQVASWFCARNSLLKGFGPCSTISSWNFSNTVLQSNDDEMMMTTIMIHFILKLFSLLPK